jgi:flagellar biogenesis protein FliO
VRVFAIFLAIVAVLAVSSPARSQSQTKFAPAVAHSANQQSDSLELTPLAPQTGGNSGRFDQNTPSSAMEIGRVMLALGAVIALIIVLRIFAKRVIPGASGIRASAAVKILGRCPVSARQNLLVVQFGKRLVLVGEGGAGLNPLCEITDPQEVEGIVSQAREETISMSRRFESMFGRARKDFDETTEQTAIEPFSESRDIPAREEPAEDDPSLRDTRKELSDLQEKVRNVARQMGRA